MDIKNQYLILIDNIKFYRKKLNITQEELAELADLSCSYIKQIESDKNFRNITLYSLLKIANALDVDISKLFERNNSLVEIQQI